MAQVRNGPVVHAPGPFALVRRALALVLRPKPLFAALLAAGAALAGSPAAMAWGNQGHRITGLFADTLLTPRIRAQILQLTGSSSLADLATWAEDNRPGLSQLIDNSAQWHYDNRPVCDAAAPVSSYCAGGNCASAALTRFESTLADPRASHEQRSIALRFLIHVLGDIHQPLHVGDNGDAGGNRRNVKLAGAPPRNLHSLWDIVPLQRMLEGSDEQGLVAGLREYFAADIVDWQRGSEAQWMNESYVVAQQHAYGALPGFQCNATPAFVTPLAEGYVREAQAQEARQLARAGARIAETLNRLFDPK